MKKVLIFSIVLFLASKMYAQTDCKCDSFQYEKYFDEKLVGKAFVNPNLKNKIQFFNNWTKGDVIFTNGVVAQNKLLRYNGYVNELVWLRKQDYQVSVINRQLINGFVLYNPDGSEMARFIKQNMNEWYALDSVVMYLQVLTDGPVSFYSYRKISANKTDTEFFTDYQYFLKINDKTSNFVISNWAFINQINLVRQFKTDKSAIRAAIRSEHLKLKGEREIARALELYNKSLKEEPTVK